MPDAAAIEQADRAMREWQWPTGGPVRIGSAAHKEMFCRVLLETHHPYKPAIIDWPALDDAARERLVALPIWDLAVRVEGHASARVSSYGETIGDPQLRDAILMDGAEEMRHKKVMHHMVAAYGIKLAPEPAYPVPLDPLWGFLITGFAECIDSFFAFGLFALAAQSGFFPKQIVDTFEPVIQEECRHILFFANWYAWYWRNLPLLRRPRFWLKCLGIFVEIAKERLETARDVGGGANFTTTGHKSLGIDVGFGELLALCLAEDDRRFAGYDQRLVRPKLAPFLARLILPFLKRGGNAAGKQRPVASST